MKKIIKLFPVLFTIPMLASCNKNYDFKAPKFLDKGESISIKEFINSFTEKIASIPAFAEDAKNLSSISAVTDVKQYTKIDLNRGGEVIESNIMYENLDSLYEVDTVNQVIYKKIEIEEFFEEKNRLYDMKERCKGIDDEEYLQEYENGVVKVDVQNGLWEQEATFIEDETMASYLDSRIIYVFEDLMFVDDFMPPLDNEEEIKNYKFYKNNDIYTIEENSEKTVEAEEGDKYSSKIIQSNILQANLAEDNYSLVYYMSKTNELTYIKDYSSYKKDDVLTTTSKNLGELNIQNLKKPLEKVSLDNYSEKVFSYKD